MRPRLGSVERAIGVAVGSTDAPGEPSASVAPGDGGTIVAAGTPEQIAEVEASYTGRYLAPVLERDAARIES